MVHRPVTVVAFSNPYVIREFGWVGSGYVASFGRGDAMERAAARGARQDAMPFQRSRAPIALPGFFNAGDGIAIARRPRHRQVPRRHRCSRCSTRGVRDSVFPGAIADRSATAPGS
jgi:hypothetical protein